MEEIATELRSSKRLRWGQGADYLNSIDLFAKSKSLNYVRYMDYFVIYTKSRHKFRRVMI